MLSSPHAKRASPKGERAIAEGYKRAIDEIRGPIAKNGLSGQNPKILAKKNVPLFTPNHVPATTGQCCPKEKVPFYQIINGE